MSDEVVMSAERRVNISFNPEHDSSKDISVTFDGEYLTIDDTYQKIVVPKEMVYSFSKAVTQVITGDV